MNELQLTAIQSGARIVYIISENDTGMHKVGITKNPNSLGRRLSNLQSGNPRKLNITAVYHFTEDGQAYAMEQNVLKAFSFNNLGLHDEWFQVSAYQLMKYIERAK